LTAADKINETIMLSLRTMEGIDLEKIKENFGSPEKQRLLCLAEKWMQRNQLVQENGHLILTDSGKHFADGIAADFFI
jgi:oxygen-independent coproporphyrinogen-3 oxidase